jgi:hypothetical protein
MKKWWVYYAYQPYMHEQYQPAVQIVDAEDRDNAIFQAGKVLKEGVRVLDVREAVTL